MSDFITLIGIESEEIFGNHDIGRQIISTPDINSAETFGAPIVSDQVVSMSGSSIDSEETFGASVVSGQVVSMTDINSEEAFGAPIVSDQVVSMSGSGIDSEEAFGDCVVGTEQTINFTSIPSEENINTGHIVFVPSPQTIDLTTGIISDENVETGHSVILPAVQIIDLNTRSIVSGEFFGETTIPLYIFPIGITSQEMFDFHFVFAGLSGSHLSPVLSGGSFNTKPSLSIGGNPSATIIVNDKKNNLFSDVSLEKSQQGLTDYRCLYFFNDSGITLKDVTLTPVDQVSGTLVNIGIAKQTESQRVLIDGNYLEMSGTFEILYEGRYSVSILHDIDPLVWESNFQSAIQTIPGLNGVTASLIVSEETSIFTVKFEGDADLKSHELLEIQSNNLSNFPDIFVSRLIGGAPVNSIADEIEIDTDPPFNVKFFNEIKIDSMKPFDGVPIWFARQIPQGAGIIADDGFALNLKVDI